MELIEPKTELLVAVKKSGKTQKAVAKKAGIQPSILSLAISGRYLLDNKQKRAIAKVLNHTVEELFPE
jgi:lambda repressor-like predicted transcriptional regulator